MKPVPAGGLLHPAALAAVGALLLNDHALKGAGLVPAVVTGKLSDFAGLAFFPLLLIAMAELARSALGRSWGPRRSDVAAAVVVTGVVFAAIQVHAPSGEVHRRVFGALRWVFFGAVRGYPMRPVQHVMDPTDLAALIALVLPWSVGMRRADDAHGLDAEPPPDAPSARRAVSARTTATPSQTQGAPWSTRSKTSITCMPSPPPKTQRSLPTMCGSGA